MPKLNGRVGGKDMTGQYSGDKNRQQQQQPNVIKLRNMQKFLDARAYNDCTVHLRTDFDGKKRKPIKGKFASFNAQLGLLITDKENNKHYLLPNRGIIEMVEFERRK